MLKKIASTIPNSSHGPILGVFTPCDPRVDQDSRERAANIVRMVAEAVAAEVRGPLAKRKRFAPQIQAC